MCFDRSFPPTFVREVAPRLEADGLDQLWVIEDCFFTTAPSIAATALALTERLTVGIGIMPAVVRNPALTAMEIATLERLAPGRVIGGIGHGVQSWMRQINAHTPSPLTTLEEVITSVKRLLAGETVSVEGREVTLRGVALEPAPDNAPPILAGVRSPKSLALAGRIADGLVLVEAAGPTYVRDSLTRAGHPPHSPGFQVTAFSALCLTDDRSIAHRIMAPFVAGLLDGLPNPAIEAHPNFEEIHERYREGGVDAIATMPADWWIELGAIGDLDDVRAHVATLHEAGVDNITFFPGPDLDLARDCLDAAARIARS
jgi:alkanesulfonate monooxygenase SsuD/methylene tetrahydromethanopterin reductase-like flavin-dependent oxidoreductase (luciferase family)